MWNFLKALSIFAGTIIGVGIFGLPYVAMKAGFLVVVLYFIFLTAIALAVHLMYGEISLEIKQFHRLPGAAGAYLGARWKKFTFLITGMGLAGAILAYLIVGGEFLYLFLGPILGGSSLIYSLLFFALGAFFIFYDKKSMSLIEFSLLLVFFTLLTIFFLKAQPFINANHFKGINLSFFSLPYGVILFSLWGSNIIPEIKEVLNGNARLLRWVTVTGILLATTTYLFFIYIILGVSGPFTSKEAISGLAAALGNGIVKFGFVFGVITCFTSFLTLGTTLKKILWHDFGAPHFFSWVVACFLPLFLFLLGAKNFIEIIGLTGAVAIGVMGIIIVLLYKKFLQGKGRKMSLLMYVLPVIFALGVFIEIFYFVR